MKLIAGLGNPGAKFASTRHNVGFRVLDHIAEQQGIRWQTSRERAEIAEIVLNDEKMFLIKPTTFMNDSGLAIAPLLRFYKITTADLLVIVDDLDLPVGRVRLREKGSDGGQRGIRSIITHLNTDVFARLRVGIGRTTDPHIDTVTYVLGTPRDDDAIRLHTGEDRAAEAALVWLLNGTTFTMNLYNAETKPTSTKPANKASDNTKES